MLNECSYAMNKWPDNLLISDVSKVVEIIKSEGHKGKVEELGMISENMRGEPCMGARRAHRHLPIDIYPPIDGRIYPVPIYKFK